MPTRKPKGYPPSHVSGGSSGASVATLRRRAAAYREKADALEATLRGTQEQFAESFSAADAQVSTRDRIAAAARRAGRPSAGGAR